jgi:dCTP deaminase
VVLSNPDLLKYIRGGRIRFDPPIDEARVAQVSVDLTLGRKFTSFKQPPGYLPAIHVDPSLWESADIWDHREQDVYRLEPGQFVLAQTLERVYIPADLVGLVEGRSSYARVGVTVHVTAPKIDPGFDASITLEMANFGKVAVDLRAGVDVPAQLIFLRLSKPVPAADLYGTRKGDRFQHQTDPIPRSKPGAPAARSRPTGRSKGRR